jgi:multidrug efflux pump
MWLSDISVTRPVLASVISLLLIAFGLVTFDRLPLRQYPDIDPPIVSVETAYPGAAANIVETRVTQVIEERIAGVEGIQFIESTSSDGRSEITIQFRTGRDIESATNDVRDRVSGVLDNLPDEATSPEVVKVGANAETIMWLNLRSDRHSISELSDYAERYLADRFSILPGVARVRIGGGKQYAMRIWLDRSALAARGLTAVDVENALRSENVELPAGSIESQDRQFTVRVDRTFETAEDFRGLVLQRGETGYLIRLGDVARVERGTVEDRTFFRGNGVPMVGIGITRQSTANTIEVARAARTEAERLNENLPDGMAIVRSYDSSVFVSSAINEVYKTLFIAISLVIATIFLFLGSVRAMIIPAVTVPVSITATFILLNVFGFSINLLTLLALVLAIGLVVDDAIVVLENIHRRIEEYGETPLVAAYKGTREVGFAVVATTAVLIAVFVPIALLQGDVGRLFSEFALTMASAVVFSSFVALSLAPMLASKLLRPSGKRAPLVRMVDGVFGIIRFFYRIFLIIVIKLPLLAVGALVAVSISAFWLLDQIPSEYTPTEDRSSFFIFVSGPEGATYSFMEEYMDEVERRLLPMVESGEMTRLLVRTPGSFGTTSTFNSGFAIVGLAPWGERRPVGEIMAEVRQRLSSMPGIQAFPIPPRGIGGRSQKPLQFVVGGSSYEELSLWREILLRAIDEDNPGLTEIDWDYNETRPQLRIQIDYDLAAEMGVSVSAIGRTLETMLGQRRVTTYIDDGFEYDVIMAGERDMQRTPSSLENIYVRSERSGELMPLANFISFDEVAASTSLNRYNRVRALTIEADLAPDYSLGEAIDYMEELVRTNLPEHAVIDYKGESLELVTAGGSTMFVFVMGLIVVFLVLAAQFESWVHPFIILLTVPLAMAGGLYGLYLTGNTLNIYSQIGLVMLVGLASKNGILIVEFANQLRGQGKDFDEALIEACLVRLRPILMTAITTAAGAVPLILAFGAGAESRIVIGVVVFAGVTAATLLTLFVIPAIYSILARRSPVPGSVKSQLEREAAPIPAPAE